MDNSDINFLDLAGGIFTLRKHALLDQPFAKFHPIFIVDPK